MNRIDTLIARMTLPEKLGQLTMTASGYAVTGPVIAGDSTQAIIDVSYGPKGLALLRAGMAPGAIIKAIWDSDPDPRPSDWTKQGRQFAIMDAKGNYAAFTGPKASAWAGHKGGAFCTAQGNILAGEAVVNAMVEAFEKTEGHLSLRLMAALDAGQKAGGDTRGMQSAAMLIVSSRPAPPCPRRARSDARCRLRRAPPLPSSGGSP